MDYLKNHCWCHSSNWDGKSYDCKIIVTIQAYGEDAIEDFNTITTAVEGFDQARYEQYKTMNCMKDLTDNRVREQCTRDYNTLKPEVIDWLTTNVPDNSKGDKMWCIGDVSYQMAGSSCMSVFFQQRQHAMAFIKRWSKWKKPVHYTQYFTDVRKKLNLTTMKYE
jgi:hypothetical protein